MRNRIPRRNLTERTRVIARMAQDAAYRTYVPNVLASARQDDAVDLDTARELVDA